jgi:hypothetical protein
LENTTLVLYELDDLIHSDGATIINILRSSGNVIGMTATPKGVLKLLQTYNRANHNLVSLDLTYSPPYERITKIRQGLFGSKVSTPQGIPLTPQKISLHKRDLSEELTKLTKKTTKGR